MSEEEVNTKNKGYTLEERENSYKEAPLEEEIFGADTASSGEEPQSDSDNEIKTKGASSGGRSKKKTKVSERVLEARRDFDEALEKIKSQGSRRRKNAYDPTDPIDLDEIASSLRRKMENAVAKDNECVETGQAALAKHMMLPEVLEMLNRKHMHEILLDSGVLFAIRLWLEPLPNKSLPAIHLRKALLEILRTLPVETDHLRESEIGKIVMFFARRSKETPEIQRLAKELVSRWSRPLIGDRSVSGNDAAEIDDESGRRLDATAPKLQSMAFKEMAGRVSDAGLTGHQKKLVMQMQKRSKSKRT